MTTETTVATAAGQDWRQAAISQAARHLYDAETALHTARQSGVSRSPTARQPRAARFIGGAWQSRGMADDSVHRTVTVARITQGVFTVSNTRGGQLTFGTGGGTEFTPTELLLAAIGGCTAIDVDILTSRRAEPDRFRVRVDADKVRDTGGNRLTGIQVTFQITFPSGGPGDQARAILPDAVSKSHDRLCTVGRTVEIGTPITTRIEVEGVAMSDQASEPGGSGGEADSGPEVAAEDREAAMMRKVMRMQERHREGGVDPDLDDADADAGPGA